MAEFCYFVRQWMGCRDCLSGQQMGTGRAGYATGPPEGPGSVSLVISRGRDMAGARSHCQPQHVAFPFLWVPFGSEDIKFKSLLIYNFIVSFCSSSMSKKTWSTALANTEGSASFNSPPSSPSTTLHDPSPHLLIYLLMLPLYLSGSPSALECRNVVFAAVAPANTELLPHLAHNG